NAKNFESLLPQGKPALTLQDCYTTHLHGRLLCETLRNIQSKILEFPAPLVAAWLRGVFDGDGNVRFDRRNPQVTISAWSPEANQLIRDALLRIGIVTSRSNAARRGEDGNIVIAGIRGVREFRRLVASDHPKKDEALSELVGALAGRESSASRLDGIPVGHALRSAREAVGMGQRAFRH